MCVVCHTLPLMVNNSSKYPPTRLPAPTNAWLQEIATTVGSRVRQYREGKSWTQLEVAEAIRMSKSNYWLVEAGDHPPKLETLLNLMELFGLETIEELLGETRYASHVLLTRRKVGA